MKKILIVTLLGVFWAGCEYNGSPSGFDFIGFQKDARMRRIEQRLTEVEVMKGMLADPASQQYLYRR